MGPNTGAQVPHGRDQTDRKQQGNGAPPFKVRPGRLPAPGTNKRPDPNRRAATRTSRHALVLQARARRGGEGARVQRKLHPTIRPEAQPTQNCGGVVARVVRLARSPSKREYWQCSCLVWINKFPPSTYGLEGGNELNFHLNPSRQVWIGED